MFDARYYAASDLQEMTDLRRKLVAMQLEKLFELVDARDIELLFFANDTCRPDWRFVEDLPLFLGADAVRQLGKPLMQASPKGGAICGCHWLGNRSKTSDMLATRLAPMRRDSLRLTCSREGV
jgi:hypothetical protein